jgi:DNA helicase-2/ATP-dependent DNA helicase PcrA
MDVYIYERDDSWVSGPTGDLRTFPSKSAAHAHARETLRANAPGRLIAEEPQHGHARATEPTPQPPTAAAIPRPLEDAEKRWLRLAGPPELGRSIILQPDTEAPAPWAKCDRISVADHPSLLEEVRRRFLDRTPTIYEFPPGQAAPGNDEYPEDVWAVPVDFELSSEQAWQLITANAVDARDPNSPVWSWADQAMISGAAPSPEGDVALDERTHIRVDGGPYRTWRRSELDLQTIPAIGLGATISSAAAAPQAEPDLAKDQLEAVRENTGTARIIAPAGSGKTRVLTERARYLISSSGVAPSQLTLVAYNKRAQLEIQDRTQDLPGLQVQTLNALALAIINGDRGFAARPGRVRTIGESQVRDLLDQMVQFPRRANTDPAAAWIDALSFVRLGLRDPDEVEADFSGDVATFAEFFPRYRAELSRQGLVDFDEQIYLAIEALISEPDVREQAQHRCQMMLVDEFQDLTPAHLLLIRLLSGARRNVFAVGDDDQTIYGYSGASPHWLVRFDDYFPGASHHALEVNYRCPAPVVEAAENLLSYNRYRVTKEIQAGPTNATEAESLQVEAVGEPVAATTDSVLRLIELGALPSDIAVLSRVNALLVPIQVSLNVHRIPTVSQESSRFLSRSGVAAALAWIDLATTDGHLDSRSVRAAARRPSRAISPRILDWMAEHRSVADLRNLADRLREERDQLKVHGFLDDLEMLQARAHDTNTADLVEAIRTELADSGLDRALETLDSAQRGRNTAAHSDDLRALGALARMHPDPATFAVWLEEALQVDDTTEGVELSTVHRVKGLEWPHVIIHDATEGVFPHRLNTDLEEERRVFHVALTRSRESTTIIADKEGPSVFIGELRVAAPTTEPAQDPEASRPTRPPRPTSKSGHSPKSAASTRESPDLANPAVFEALKKWRLEVAKAKGMPAYMIANDRTLTDIANRLPTDRAGLLGCHGIGEAKADDYAEAILAITATTASAEDSTPAAAEAPPAPDEQVIEAVKQWRSRRASADGVPPYRVLTDATVEALAAALPRTEAELLQTNGIGPAKLETYGDELLAIIDARK